MKEVTAPYEILNILNEFKSMALKFFVLGYIIPFIIVEFIKMILKAIETGQGKNRKINLN